MARHEYKSDSGATIFVAYDGIEDMSLMGQHLFGTSRVQAIPEGFGEWTGRWIIMTMFNKTPWAIIKPKEVNPIPDYQTFLDVFGDRPTGQTFEDRLAKQNYADRLDDWGGLLAGNFSVLTNEFTKHGMSTPVYWNNVNAHESHGSNWMYIEEADKSD